MKGLLVLFACLSGVELVSLDAGADDSDAYDDEETPELVEEMPFRSDAYDDSEPEPDVKGSGQQKESEPEPSAGGLDAPDALPEQGDQRSEIERELDQAERKDAGRGLEFAWADGFVGYQLLHLSGFSSRNLLDREDTAVSTFSFGGAAGLRVLYFTLGVRFRYSPAPEYSFWNLSGELGFKIPYGAIEPYLTLGLGYAHVGRLESETKERITGVQGLSAKLAGGVDYYFSQTFSVGGQLGLDFLSLKRPVQKSGTCADLDNCVFDKKGSSAGYALSPQLVVGLHF